MGFAEIAAKRSTCYRGNVGAVIVLEGNVVSVGYNGSPAGEPHCAGLACPRSALTGGCIRSLHAEANAIERARHGVEGGDIYCTSSPCDACAIAIQQARIHRVFFLNPYRETHSLHWLFNRGVDIYRMTPNGQLVHHHTGELVEID
jgi:dCMP deaminase